MDRKNLLVAVGLMLVFLAGCSAPPHPAVYWPPPPDPPRFEWLGTIYSEDNFEKTDSQRMQEKVVGKPQLSYFKKPIGIASDGEGVVYVADMDLGNIRVYDFNARTNHLYKKQAAFRILIGLALDSKKNLYVVDGGENRITVFSPERVPLFSFGDNELFYKAAYIAINERLGRIYVTDSKGHKVVVFSMTGEHLFSFGSWGPEDGQFYVPQGIAVDSKNRVIVADTLNARVQVFDQDGNFLHEFGERGDQIWQFEGPTGVAVDREDHVYVLDARKAALMVYQTDGTLLMTLGGKPTTHVLGFSLPLYVTVDPKQQVMITDAMNLSFTRWQYLTPEYLAEHPLNDQSLVELQQRTEALKKKAGSK